MRISLSVAVFRTDSGGTTFYCKRWRMVSKIQCPGHLFIWKQFDRVTCCCTQDLLHWTNRRVSLAEIDVHNSFTTAPRMFTRLVSCCFSLVYPCMGCIFVNGQEGLRSTSNICQEECKVIYKWMRPNGVHCLGLGRRVSQQDHHKRVCSVKLYGI